MASRLGQDRRQRSCNSSEAQGNHIRKIGVAGTLITAALTLAEALTPFIRALAGGNNGVTTHFERLGWILPQVPEILTDLQGAANLVASSLAKVEQTLRQVEEGTASNSALEQPAAELLGAIALLAVGVRQLPSGLRSQLPASYVTATQIDQLVQTRLFNDSLSRQIEYESSKGYMIAEVLGLVESIEHNEDPTHFQPAFEERVIRWDRFSLLADGPAALMRDV